MKKIITILILLVFLTACNSLTQQGKSTGTPQGLEITFLEFQPREEIRQNEYFDVGLNLINNAECDIAGEICIRDSLAESISGIEDSCQSFSLRKKENNQVDSREVYFTDNVYASISGNLISNIITRAEYSCSIQLVPQVCVKPDIGEENLCKTRETLSSSTLGLKSAPITVTSIDKLLIKQRDGMKLETVIHLRKMSEGGSESFSINVEYEGHGQLNCKNLDRISFKTNTENVINCEIPINVGDIEENPLRIDLTYLYETSKSKEVRITKEEGDNI